MRELAELAVPRGYTNTHVPLTNTTMRLVMIVKLILSQPSTVGNPHRAETPYCLRSRFPTRPCNGSITLNVKQPPRGAKGIVLLFAALENCHEYVAQKTWMLFWQGVCHLNGGTRRTRPRINRRLI